MIHKENGGVSSARNTGIEYVIQKKEFCEEDYIAFLDGDDAWNRKSVNEEMKELLNCNYDLIGFQMCKCNQDMTYRNRLLPLQEGQFRGGETSVWLHSSQSFASMFYRVGFIKRYNLKFASIKYSKDKIFSMKCLFLANKGYLENKLLYLYRTNRNSAMYRRTRGIDYYIPIIEAYLKLDQDMEIWADEARGKLNEGHILASWYLMDMVEEHYQDGGKRKDMLKFMKEHPRYIRLINDSAIGSREFSKRWKKLKSHSNMIQVKNILLGMIARSGKKVLHFSIISILYEKKKYPIKILSISEEMQSQSSL